MFIMSKFSQKSVFFLFRVFYSFLDNWSTGWFILPSGGDWGHPLSLNMGIVQMVGELFKGALYIWAKPCYACWCTFKGFCHLGSTFGVHLAIWKHWIVKTAIRGVIISEAKIKEEEKRLLYCWIWQKVTIYAHKCSSTVQDRGGGRVNQISYVLSIMAFLTPKLYLEE